MCYSVNYCVSIYYLKPLRKILCAAHVKVKEGTWVDPLSLGFFFFLILASNFRDYFNSNIVELYLQCRRQIS